MAELYTKYGRKVGELENIVKDPEIEQMFFVCPCFVTGEAKISENDCKRLIRTFGMKKPQLVGRRIAKRKNRLRRLNNWKKKAAERARYYNLPLAEKYRYLITHTVITVKKGMIDTVQDCVGLIRGMEWGGYRNE